MRWMLIAILTGCGGTAPQDCYEGYVKLVISNPDGGADAFNDCVPTCTDAWALCPVNDARWPVPLHCAAFADGTWGLCRP